MPGADGSLDMTEALGERYYGDRQARFLFVLPPGEDFERKKSEVAAFLSGRRCRIVLDRDPAYYWLGRCTLDEYASDGGARTIAVRARLEPYKWQLCKTVVHCPAGTERVLTLLGGRKDSGLTASLEQEATVTFAGQILHLPAGSHSLPQLILAPGPNRLLVSSQAPSVWIYRKGEL